MIAQARVEGLSEGLHDEDLTLGRVEQKDLDPTGKNRSIGLLSGGVGPELRIEIRAGLHTGEIELAGADGAGIAVHIGARIAALAGTSEVLISSPVKDLVVGSGIAFEDRGLRALGGVPGEWRIFAVSA